MSGHEGAGHDAAGHEGGKAHADSRAWANASNDDPRGGLPPGVIHQVAAERGADGGAKMRVEGGSQVTTSPLMRIWYMNLETSAHCLVSTISVGAFSTLVVAERSSSQVYTDWQARALICSREPKADASAVVPESQVRSRTVCRTLDVSMSDATACGLRPERAATCQRPKSQTKHCPSSTNHSSQTPL